MRTQKTIQEGGKGEGEGEGDLGGTIQPKPANSERETIMVFGIQVWISDPYTISKNIPMEIFKSFATITCACSIFFG